VISTIARRVITDEREELAVQKKANMYNQRTLSIKQKKNINRETKRKKRKKKDV